MIKKNQLLILENYKRKLFLKYELKQLILKIFYKNKINFNKNYLLILFYKSITKKNKLKIKLSYRCVISGRNFNIMRKLAVSRFIFRKYLKLSLIPGFQKK